MLDCELRKVRYKGVNSELNDAVNPRMLKVGKDYTVICTTTFHGNKYLILKDVEGTYNEEWFEEVKGEKVVEIGIGRELPVVNYNMRFKVIKGNDNLGCKNEEVEVFVKRAKHITGNFYEVTDTEGKNYRIFILDSIDFDSNSILATMNHVPKLGEIPSINQLIMIKNELYSAFIKTSLIAKIKPIGNNQFWIWTLDGLEILVFVY